MLFCIENREGLSNIAETFFCQYKITIMELSLYKTQIIETLLSLTAFFLLRYLSFSIVKLTITQSEFKHKEQREVSRLLNLILVPTFIIVIASIWVLKQSEILLFISSILTVLGVGFFAEWSILSNVTAYLVLFFCHPMKIGDTIKIEDGNHQIEGKILDITYFFMYVRNSDGQNITIPNAIILKGSFSILTA